jgi:hypothetical protein
MTIRTFYSELGDKWVCVLSGDRVAYVAIRKGETGQWELSRREWVRHEDGQQKLRIKPLGVYDDLYKAQEAIGLKKERGEEINL